MAKSTSLTLLRRKSDLAFSARQLKILNQFDAPNFTKKTCGSSSELLADRVEILQVNLGKLCNMTCQHCHVDAGPDRREIMSLETINHCLDAIDRGKTRTLDLTGGAPEMNPHFKYFVSEAKQRNCHVIDRCNLTILLANGFKDVPVFLADHDVEVVASLPCYLESNTDAQRGDGTFHASLKALRILNRLGYGDPASAKKLTLVYNPVGFSLPPDQQTLESQYREVLRKDYGIEFNQLFTITNMPISRFLEFLLKEERFDEYMQKLVDAFNPSAVSGLMCRGLISVGWDGTLYDCDFNQMLDMSVAPQSPQMIADFDVSKLENRVIQTAQHCYGCTAGSGSSCLGATV